MADPTRLPNQNLENNPMHSRLAPASTIDRRIKFQNNRNIRSNITYSRDRSNAITLQDGGRVATGSLQLARLNGDRGMILGA